MNVFSRVLTFRVGGQAAAIPWQRELESIAGVERDHVAKGQAMLSRFRNGYSARAAVLRMMGQRRATW